MLMFGQLYPCSSLAGAGYRRWRHVFWHLDRLCPRVVRHGMLSPEVLSHWMNVMCIRRLCQGQATPERRALLLAPQGRLTCAWHGPGRKGGPWP